MDDLDYLTERWQNAIDERQKALAIAHSTDPKLPSESRILGLAGTVAWQAMADEYSARIEHIKLQKV